MIIKPNADESYLIEVDDATDEEEVERLRNLSKHGLRALAHQFYALEMWREVQRVAELEEALLVQAITGDARLAGANRFVHHGGERDLVDATISRYPRGNVAADAEELLAACGEMQVLPFTKVEVPGWTLLAPMFRDVAGMVGFENVKVTVSTEMLETLPPETRRTILACLRREDVTSLRISHLGSGLDPEAIRKKVEKSAVARRRRVDKRAQASASRGAKV